MKKILHTPIIENGEIVGWEKFKGKITSIKRGNVPYVRRETHEEKVWKEINNFLRRRASKKTESARRRFKELVEMFLRYTKTREYQALLGGWNVFYFGRIQRTPEEGDYIFSFIFGKHRGSKKASLPS